MTDFLGGLLQEFLKSQLFATLLAAAGAYLVTKFPVVAKALKAIADRNLQDLVNRIYEEIKMAWAADGKVVKTAEDIKHLIDEIVSVLRKMFPDASEEKLRGMASAAVASPHTSRPSDTLTQ